MKDIHVRIKRKKNRALLWLLMILILVILLVIMAQASFHAYSTAKKAKEKLSVASHDYEELSERQSFLTSEIQRLQSDEGIEEELRSRFGFGKGGEKVVVIVRDNDNEIEDEDGVYGGFWKWLKGLFIDI